MRVNIFGSLVVTDGDRSFGPRDFSGVKPKQVLEILAVERGHSVSKSRLAELLWPDEMPRAYAATLETYVSVLRQILQPGIRARESVIVTEHGGYRLDRDRVEVDLDVFDGLIERTVGAEPHVALSMLNEALLLARGQVLEDELYVDWALHARTVYEQRRVLALTDAARLSLLTGDSKGAVTLAEHAVALNPLAEPAYQVLMSAYYSTWRQDEALEAYARCRRLLGDELGVDPLNETVALHLGILRHEDVAVLLPGARTTTKTVPVRPVAEVEPAELPLLGRDRELRQLTSAAEAALKGRFAVLLVTGEQGIGKTRLTEAAAAQLSAPVASNRCSDLESGLPYLAISLALREVVASENGAEMPVLDDLLARAEAAQPFDEFARMRVMEQLAKLLNGAGPLVIVLDDAEWADPETITALKYLRRRCATAPVVVLIACDRAGLAKEGLRSLHPDLRIDLDVLSADVVAPLGESVHLATDGHPYFLADWLEARRAGLQEGFSTHVRDRVVTRCWDLGAQAYRLASVATVLEQPFAPGTLAALVDARVDEITEELDRLITHGLLRAEAHGFSFRYAPVRQILHETLSPARRVLLEQKAATASQSPRRRASDRVDGAPSRAAAPQDPGPGARVSDHPSLSNG